MTHSNRNHPAKRTFALFAVGVFLVATALTVAEFGSGHTPPAEAQAVNAPARGAEPGLGPNIFVNLAKKSVPSVVNISTLSVPKGGGYGQGGPGMGDDPFRKFWEFFFQGPQGGWPPGAPGLGPDKNEGKGGKPNVAPRAHSMGSGFIIDEAGLILTNNHVVAGADEIQIQFSEDDGEKPTKGEVVGRDPELDLALIKVKTSRKLVAIAFGDSDALEVGEYVMAVGNPFGQGHTVTHGIISAKGRNAPDFPLARYLQTDAPINPGNSGGPLINLKGEVIGINNAIDARAQGIGFAIPINLVKRVLPQLKTKGSVQRGYIGVLVNDLTPELAEQMGIPKNVEAPFAAHVYPGEPADQAGIKPYDAILEFNGKRVRTASELIGEVTAVDVGKSVKVKVNRAGKEVDLTLTVKSRPSAQDLAKNAPADRGRERQEPKIQVETGMAIETLTPKLAQELGVAPGTKGVVVASLDYDGPAARAGLMRGDVILEVDRKPVKSAENFTATVKEKKSYLLRVQRSGPGGQPVFMVIVLDLKS